MLNVPAKQSAAAVRRATAAAWSPLDLPGIALWLDASDAATITSSGGVVSAWADKSGTGRNAGLDPSAAGPQTEAATQNGKNVLTFGAASTPKCLTLGSKYIFDDSAMSLWVAAQATGGSGDNFVLDFGLFVSAGWGMYINPGMFGAYKGTRYDNAGTYSAAGAFGLQMQAGTPGFVRKYFGGTTVRNTSVNPLSGFGDAQIDESATRMAGSGPMTIGYQSKTASQAGRYFIGNIFEMLVVAGTVPSDENRALIVAYLTEKWGL